MTRIPAIDALRGIAILAVIYQHGYSAGLSSKIVQSGLLDYGWLISNAWMGVGLFFVLSGFVLSVPYFQGRRVFDKGGLKAYYLARARRLIPLLVLGATFGTILVIISGSGFRPAIRSYFLTITATNIFTIDQFFASVFPVSWSLSVEIWASIMLPLVVLGMRSKRWLIAFGAILIMALAVRIFGADQPFVNVHVRPIKDSVFGRLDDFAVGVALARLYVEDRMPKVLGNGWLAVCALLVAAVGWDLVVQGYVGPWLGAYLNTFSQIGFASLVAAAVAGKWHHVYGRPIIQLAGAMCFSLYTWHGFIMGWGLQARPFDIIQNLMFWILLIVFASITYRFVEFPNVEWRKLFRFKPSPAIA